MTKASRAKAFSHRKAKHRKRKKYTKTEGGKARDKTGTGDENLIRKGILPPLVLK